MPKRIVLALACLLSASACSSSSPSAATTHPPQSESAAASQSAVAQPSETAAASGASGSVTPAPTRIPGTAPKTNAAPPSGVAIPKAGAYTYGQSGDESFCTGPTTCSSPQPLPPQMTATLSRAGGGGVTLELKIASGRTVRAALSFSKGSVYLTELYAEFTEQGVTQSATLDPTPAIRMLNLDATSGATWSGRFTDGDYTGSYSFAEKAAETIKAAGGSHRTDRTDGSITVDGPDGGTISLKIWRNPETNVFLRIAGTLDVHSGFVTYKGHFTDTLTRGPQI